MDSGNTWKNKPIGHICGCLLSVEGKEEKEQSTRKEGAGQTMTEML